MPTPARIALITGASGGIGSAIARRFAAEGFRLALCGRNTEKLESVRAGLPQGTEALLLPGDVNDAGYQDACLAAVQARFGGLDVLVNCAGMAQSDAFEDITPARFDEIMTVFPVPEGAAAAAAVAGGVHPQYRLRHRPQGLRAPGRLCSVQARHGRIHEDAGRGGL